MNVDIMVESVEIEPESQLAQYRRGKEAATHENSIISETLDFDH